MINIANLKPFDKIDIVRKATGFTPSQKLILFCLASHLGNNHFCFLSLRTLERETALSRSTISDNLRLLILANVVIKKSPSDGFMSNRYAINFEMVVVLHYHPGSVTLLGGSPQATRVVVSHYPKRNLNKSKRKLKKGELVDNSKSEAQTERNKAEVIKIKDRLPKVT